MLIYKYYAAYRYIATLKVQCSTFLLLFFSNHSNLCNYDDILSLFLYPHFVSHTNKETLKMKYSSHIFFHKL